MENTKIYCPCCESELKVTHSDRYQDLMEHVGSPNHEPSMKNGYQCTNVDCESYKTNATWIEDGSLYTTPPEGMTYSEASKRFDAATKIKDGWAIGSWNYYYHQGLEAIKSYKKSFKIWKFKIDVEPRMLGHKYPTEKQYMPNLLSWKFTYWKLERDGKSYVNIIPHFQMIKYRINKFKSDYNSALYNSSKNTYSIKECLEAIECKHFGHIDDRFWAKASSWIIKTFMTERVKIIKDLALQNNVKI